MYTPKELALRAAKALDDRKGLKIRLLQVTDCLLYTSDAADE